MKPIIVSRVISHNASRRTSASTLTSLWTTRVSQSMSTCNLIQNRTQATAVAASRETRKTESLLSIICQLMSKSSLGHRYHLIKYESSRRCQSRSPKNSFKVKAKAFWVDHNESTSRKSALKMISIYHPLLSWTSPQTYCRVLIPKITNYCCILARTQVQLQNDRIHQDLQSSSGSQNLPL